MLGPPVALLPQVNCFENICGFSGTYVGEDSDNPTLPTANQLWRWVLSIFIYLGVIHLVLVLPIQLYVGIKIERTIGWLRIGLIYIISGVGGNIVSCVNEKSSALCNCQIGHKVHTGLQLGGGTERLPS